MKKLKLLRFFALGAMFLFASVTYAGTKGTGGDPPGEPIPLSIINDDHGLESGFPKSPEDTPTVSLDDHTLYFAEAFCEVVAIELKDANGTVVYSTNLPVGSSSVILPSTLSGNYTIYIIYISGYIYYGQISL